MKITNSVVHRSSYSLSFAAGAITLYLVSQLLQPLSTIFVVVVALAANNLLTEWIQPKNKRTKLAQSQLETDACDRGVYDGATVEGNDLSMFYGNRRQLTTIRDQCRYLPSCTYATLVRDAVVCCVDIVLVRNNATLAKPRKECLLVLRSSEPAKGLWWYPGGRLLKGETFFDAAVRKAQEEVGMASSAVKPVQVLGIWNTFFPTSAWDNETSRGTQTVNAVVLVEIGSDAQEKKDDNDEEEQCDQDDGVKLDSTSDEYRWIGLDPDVAAGAGEDPYVVTALRRLKSWNPGYDI